MSQQLTCDLTSCGLLIQDGTERIDITLPDRRDTVSHEVVNGGYFNFHYACYQQAGPLLPAPGLTVTIRRVAATVAAPVEDPAPALPDPLRAPAN